MRTSRDNTKRFIRFLLVGVTAFIIYTLTLWLLKRVLGVNTPVSVTIAFGITITYHFLLSNFFTFNNSDADYKKRILGYIAVVACNYAINIVIVSTILNIVIDNVLVASATSTAITMFFNFFVLSRIVFSDSKTA